MIERLCHRPASIQPVSLITSGTVDSRGTHAQFIVAASSGVMLSGTFQVSSAGVLTYSANAPLSLYVPPWTNAATMSPTARLVTFFPTLTTRPAKSQPQIVPGRVTF